MIETVAFAREHLEQAHALRDPLPVAADASRGERRQARRLARALPTP
jgi:hypothetical protein